MQEEEHLFKIEVMPKVKGFWCKLLVYLIYLGMSLGPIVLGGFCWWYFHSLWIGFLSILFFMLISGIITSKMRINSIPFEQREMNYSTIAIVKWFVGKNICEQ
jgi:hypothetical protein